MMSEMHAGDDPGNRTNRRLTPEQVEAFDTDGYLLLPTLLDAEDLRPVKEAMTQKVDLIAGELVKDGLVPDTLDSEPFETRLARLFDRLDASVFLRYGRGWRDRFEGYFWLMQNAKILDVVEDLIGPEIFASPIYNVRPKVPRVSAGAVPWHQDRSYWPDVATSPVLTVWIAVADADETNGCLRVIPKTHRDRLEHHHLETYSGTGYTELDDGYVRGRVKRARSVPVPAGGALVFNDRFVHSSGPNNSAAVRWSVDLRYSPAGQDRMSGYGAGFVARSRLRPESVAELEDWLAGRAERTGAPS